MKICYGIDEIHKYPWVYDKHFPCLMPYFVVHDIMEGNELSWTTILYEDLLGFEGGNHLVSRSNNFSFVILLNLC